MRRLFILCIAASISTSGCKKESVPTGAFSGIYIQQTGSASRIQLNFITPGKVVVTGGTPDFQSWASASDNFNLELAPPMIFFTDPANSKNIAGYWYHLGTKDGANTLTLSLCGSGIPCLQDYYFVQQP